MPVIELTQEQHELERAEEIEDRDWAASREEARRQHELNLARIKATIPQRHKTITRIGIACVKLPALVVLSLTLPLLVIAGKSIPKPLEDFWVL